ncbi:MAG: NADH:ubiquinone reductase (Na(+)-transporting) subunit F [Deltaproteobacteria bacterium]|nr:NADH:ubiquinone reductase (Na(+)-transporting) subunit F [Deltaproteobacteria bacterium]
MNTILFGMLGFTITIVVLTVLLLIVKARLSPGGTVKVGINHDEEKTLEVQAGGTLLGTLASNGIFIPSACGGKGTCGVCRCRVSSGGGALLPTEVSHITPKEARDGMRLACQVRMKENLEIELPPEVFDVQRWTCRVRSNHNVATFIKELILELPEGEEVPFRAGGYIQIECPPHVANYKDYVIEEEYREDWDKLDMWRFVSKVDDDVVRAYSMASYPDEKGEIMLNVRIASPPPRQPDLPPGQLSSWIFDLRPGDEVVISGPFGEFFARETDNEMCFIGGGAGMAPMRSHIFDQFRRLHTDRKVTFWYGARSLREAFYVEHFDAIDRENENFSWYLALSEPVSEDRWAGHVGFIHQVLYDNYLKDHSTPEDIEYYLCGPPMMIAACKKMLDDLGVEPENVMFDDFGE